MTLVLASSSPRRNDLLRALTEQFEVVPSRVDEREPFPGEDPAAYALALAREKGAEVASRMSGALILSADTVVAVGDRILGKPEDPGEAKWMLELLRGRDHIVVTAVVLTVAGQQAVDSETAVVRMRPYSEEEIDAYVATGESMDKAGGYALQGLGGALVEGVRGCPTAVIGLPLCTTWRLLHAAGVQLLTDSPDAACQHRADFADNPAGTS